MNELQIIQQNGQLLVDSRDVARMVGKEHKNLLSDIRSYLNVIENSGELKIKPSDFFIQSQYFSVQNKSLPCYLLTKKGCDMVANKLTGEKGVLFTATYVNRFDEMEKQLKQVSHPSYMIEDPIARAQQWIEEQKQRLMLEQQVQENAPKITYYDTILKSTKLLTITQIAKDYGLSGRALNKILHEEGIQYKLSGQWLLYRNYQDKGYTKSQTYIDSTDEARLSTKWTQKGRLFIHNILTNLGYDPDKKG